MSTAPQMSEALAKLWMRFLPDIRQRVAVLEAAAQSLANEELSAEEREAAHAAAHKLAGVLGTFGLNRGTELARMCEEVLVEGVESLAAVELIPWIAELRGLIEQHEQRKAG